MRQDAILERCGLDYLILLIAATAAQAAAPQPPIESARSPEIQQAGSAISALVAVQQTTELERYARLEYLLEKTIFKIDVLWLTITVDDQTAAAVDSIVTGRRRTDELESAVASRYMATRRADITLVFERSVGFGRFIGGTRNTSRVLVRHGFIDAASAERIDRDMETRFAFLRDTGIRKGDSLSYSLRGDSVVARYVGVNGDTEFEEARVDPQWRLWILGSYFAAGTDFRNGLLRLIFGR